MLGGRRESDRRGAGRRQHQDEIAIAADTEQIQAMFVQGFDGTGQRIARRGADQDRATAPDLANGAVDVFKNGGIRHTHRRALAHQLTQRSSPVLC